MVLASGFHSRCSKSEIFASWYSRRASPIRFVRGQKITLGSCRTWSHESAIGHPSRWIVRSAGFVQTITAAVLRSFMRSCSWVHISHVLPEPVGPTISSCSGSGRPRSSLPHAAIISGPRSDHGRRFGHLNDGSRRQSAVVARWVSGSMSSRWTVMADSPTAGSGEGGSRRRQDATRCPGNTRAASQVPRTGTAGHAPMPFSCGVCGLLGWLLRVLWHGHGMGDVVRPHRHADRLQGGGELEVLHEPARRSGEPRHQIRGVAHDLRQRLRHQRLLVRERATADRVTGSPDLPRRDEDEPYLRLDVLADRGGDADAAPARGGGARAGFAEPARWPVWREFFRRRLVLFPVGCFERVYLCLQVGRYLVRT